jgi:hypothetical protein
MELILNYRSGSARVRGRRILGAQSGSLVINSPSRSTRCKVASHTAGRRPERIRDRRKPARHSGREQDHLIALAAALGIDAPDPGAAD